MTNLELINLLKQYPDNFDIIVRIDLDITCDFDIWADQQQGNIYIRPTNIDSEYKRGLDEGYTDGYEEGRQDGCEHD